MGRLIDAAPRQVARVAKQPSLLPTRVAHPTVSRTRTHWPTRSIISSAVFGPNSLRLTAFCATPTGPAAPAHPRAPGTRLQRLDTCPDAPPGVRTRSRAVHRRSKSRWRHSAPPAHPRRCHCPPVRAELAPASRPRYVRVMCGRARFSSDVSEVKLVFSIPPHRPTPDIAPSWNAVAREAISLPAATQTSVL